MIITPPQKKAIVLAVSAITTLILSFLAGCGSYTITVTPQPTVPDSITVPLHF